MLFLSQIRCGMSSHKAIVSPEDLPTRMALFEMSVSHINNSLIRIENRFDKIDERFDKIDKKFDKIDDRFEKMDGKIDSNFKWLLTFMIGGFASMFGMITGLGAIMAHGFHWY